MRIVSSSSHKITLASPTGELVVLSSVGLCLLVIGFALLVGSVPPDRWWSLRFGGGVILFAGFAILLTTRYRRWTFDGKGGTAVIETYSLLGRSQRLESGIADVSVRARPGYQGRRWNWFVLRKEDGAEIELGPTGHLGLDGARKTVAAVRSVLEFPTNAGGDVNGPGIDAR